MHVTRQGANDAMTPESIQDMIDRAIQRNSNHTQDDASQSSGGELRRPVQPARVCSYTNFMKCQPLNFKFTEGVVGLSQWLKKMESVFHISSCTIDNQVKFATYTLLGVALTWWNGHVRTLELLEYMNVHDNDASESSQPSWGKVYIWDLIDLDVTMSTSRGKFVSPKMFIKTIDRSKLEYKFQDQENSQDIFSFRSALEDFICVVSVPDRNIFEISSWRGARVDVRTYLLGGAIDSSEANGIIRDPKLELENSRFTFDLVPLSYESVDVVVGENWLLRHKAEMVKVGSNNNSWWEVSVLLDRKEGVRVAHEDDRGVSKGREDVREVFQQRGSGANRKLSRCGRNQMGNELILALPKGADDFIVLMKDYMANVMLYRRVGRRSEAKNEFEIDVQRSDLEMESGSYWLDKVRTSIWRDVRTLAIEEAYTTKYYIHLGADMMVWFRLSNRWLSMKKDVASYGRTVEFVDREVKSLKRSKIVLVQFRWNSKRGPEFTWERKDQMRSKCPQLFVDSDIASSS
ncbi:hypothetical protein Tco_0261589 [Tanacetum coccineum]